jgi:hypothetical protein
MVHFSLHIITDLVIVVLYMKMTERHHPRRYVFDQAKKCTHPPRNLVQRDGDMAAVLERFEEL